MKKILLFLFILFAQNAFSCSCVVIENFQTKDDLSAYDYIALVKITALPPVHSGWGGSRSTGDINVTTIEQFKGDTTSLIFDTAYRGNCRMGVSVGDQWIIFGSIKEGKVLTESCSYTSFYKTKTGERNWTTGFKRLDKLRRIYKPEQEVAIPDIIKYPDGRTEIEQHFKNGKLDGVRTIYYPNGSIYVKEDFKNGVRKSFRKVYYRSGAIASEFSYKNNYVIGKISYYDTLKLKAFMPYEPDMMKDFASKRLSRQQIDSIVLIKIVALRSTEFWKKPVSNFTVFSDKGAVSKGISYDKNGKLSGRQYFDGSVKKGGYQTFKDGKMVYELVTDGNTHTQLQTSYENGMLVKRTYPCNTCETFLKGNIAEAVPEEIFIPYD